MPWKDIERIASTAGRYYSPFDRRKTKGEGKWRHIDNPRGVLKDLQRKIHRQLLAPIVLPDTILGGVRGRSVRDHAEAHVGQPILVTLDLSSCFPSITRHAIYDVYMRQVECSPAIARILTQLTSFQQALPQGAPTSPTLANLALLDLHRELQVLARNFGLALTFYVDDIAISGARAREAVEPTILAVMRHGHGVSRRKIVVAHSGVKQALTGHVVNSVVSIDRPKRRDLYQRILDLASVECPLDVDLRSVRSSIAHVEYTNPSQGAVLRRLADRVLPDVGVEGRRPRTDETRVCRHRRTHRTKSATRGGSADVNRSDHPLLTDDVEGRLPSGTPDKYVAC
jgi:hypothetical protein